MSDQAQKMVADRHEFFGFSKFKDKVRGDAEANAKFKELMDDMMKRGKKDSGVKFETKEPFDIYFRNTKRFTYQLEVKGNTATFATIDKTNGRVTSTSAILKSGCVDVRLFQNLKKDEFMGLDIDGEHWEKAIHKFRG